MRDLFGGIIMLFCFIGIILFAIIFPKSQIRSDLEELFGIR